MSNTENKITLQLHEDYSIDIRKYMGSRGEYYNVNGTNYDIHFPIEWVFQTPLNESESETIPIPSFGPEECNLCAEYGYYGGVFIGYCLHCAKYANFKRGNGMIGSGVEIDQLQADALGIPIQYKDENSMWNVYMQTVELSNIGDETLETNYLSFFKEKVFDFYGWLQYGNPIDYFISEGGNGDSEIPDLHSVESDNDSDDSETKIMPYQDGNDTKLSLMLPEPEAESEP